MAGPWERYSTQPQVVGNPDPKYPYEGPKAAADAQRAQAEAVQSQAQAPYAETLAQAQARKAVADAAAAETGQQRDSSNKTKDYTLRLRGDFDALPAVKEYRTAISQLAQGLNTKADAAGDSALIYAYAKVMDPASVVRESEMTMAGAADTVIESTAARIKKQFGIEGGGQLSPTVRDGLRREMVNKVKQYNTIYNHQRQRFAADAQALGVDPQLVIGEHDGAAFMPQLSAYDEARKGNQETPGLASADATEKSIPIPAQMQAEHVDYLRQNWGRVDPEGYAQFRSGLDQKYGFGPRPDAYRDFAASLNESAQNGGSPNVPIGPVNADIAGRDKLNASLFNNPVGAAVMGAGSLGGGMDEVAGGIRSTLNGTDYATERDLTDSMRKAAADAYPLSTITGQLLGAGLTGYAGGSLIPGAAINTLGKAATVGAGYGGVSGALENNQDRAMGGLFGSTLGAVGGTIGQKLIAPAAERLTRSFSRTVPQVTPGQATLGDMTGDIDNVRANLTLGRDLNMPYSLADADPRLRALAGMVSRKSVNARALAEETFEPRALDQSERAMRAVSDHLGPPVDIAARQQDWRRVASERAGPLYDEAYQGGSTAPLETQMQDAFNVSSKAVADARSELARAQREATVSAAGVSRAGENVYMNATALPANRSANAAIEGAQSRLAQAETAHQQVVDQLRRSQGDAASNAPGAVWNPRLQQFIDDPLSKGGLSRGLEIQRLEALAEGKPFDPTEYAITGYDQAGNPIVGNVPNLRTLDAIKKGYDAILEEYPRNMKGEQIFDQRGRAIAKAKQSLVGELDTVTGGELGPYASARNTYGTYAQLGQSLGEGYSAAPKGTYARDIQSRVGGMDMPNLEEYRTGYATRLRDMIADTPDASDPYKLVYGGNERRAKMQAVFPQGAGRFGQVYDMEREMAKTAHETLGGSPTAQRLQADAQLGDAIGTGLELGADVLSGGGFSGAKGLLSQNARQWMGDALRMGVGKRAQAKADEIAPVLYSTNPEEALKALDAFALRRAAINDRRNVAARYGGLFGAALLPSLAVPGS